MANIALNEEAQLNLDMEAMTVNTEGHCDEWNVRHRQLLENDSWLNSEIEKVAQVARNKVNSELGKGLSTNDYTTEEKDKLGKIEAEANKTVVDDELSVDSTNPVQNKVVSEAINESKKKLEKLLPDLPVPTIEDVGKVLKIGAGGKAVWAIDSSAQWQSMFPDFAFSTTTDFSGDGNKHVEVTYSNGYKTVSDVLDSKTVKEMLYDPAGQLLATKMVTIAEDGKSVAETVTAE